MGSYFSSPKPQIPPLPESPISNKPDRSGVIYDTEPVGVIETHISNIPDIEPSDVIETNVQQTDENKPEPETHIEQPEQQTLDSEETEPIEEPIPEQVKEPVNMRKRRKKKRNH